MKMSLTGKSLKLSNKSQNQIQIAKFNNLGESYC